jgi:hypothetical protein
MLIVSRRLDFVEPVRVALDPIAGATAAPGITLKSGSTDRPGSWSDPRKVTVIVYYKMRLD